ncbi:kinase-like domain-containing protein [Immersiella caudata]|uniref:Kinase-like domain-containing protein n=1 Tax=Immersiella caudata TaxID=314043 RepID=A0AA40C795_9PEZI|nr:kinase-like domain-containing protein [Immersiella caudata]
MSSHPSQQQSQSQSQSQSQPAPTTSSPLIPPSDRTVTPGDRNARFLDAAATIAAAERLNNHNAHANSAIELYSSVAPPVTPRVTNTSTDTSTRPSTASSTPRLPSSHIQFRSQTIAPSPPTRTPEAVSTATPRPLADESAHSIHLSSSLLQTEIHPATPLLTDAPNSFSTPSRSPSNRTSLTLQHKTSASSLKPISRTPSLRTGSYRESVFGGPSATSSCYPSPVISAMGDVTPLPSPLLANDSPGPWKKLGRRTSRDSTSSPQHPGDCASPISPDDAMASTASKRKAYAGLGPAAVPKAASAGQPQPQPAQTHTRNRSISEYIPDPIPVPKRMVTVSGSHIKAELKDAGSGFEGQMRREPHLSEARGLTPIEKPPTPPPSESSISVTDSSSSSSSKRAECFEAYGMHDRKRRRWRAVRMLGQGTFSRVMLATSQISSSSSDDEEYVLPSTTTAASDLHTPESTTQYDQHRRRTLVAVKVCEHGPRGGASEDRVEMSLKRELEIMKSIHHPSLVHLKAWNIEPTRAILVLSYCPGGDLFDVASGHRELLTPGLLRRIFAELVGATSYLHGQKIVHRDIKLENVLVNLPTAELCSGIDWATYPYSVTTLTDLGLSRRVADDEKLETRCGSEDYAAPEVIMGQPYDGRAIDAWSLGVLLYALLESRLPFDPLPIDPRLRSRTSHRIARIEWRWVEYGTRPNEVGEGEHEASLKRFDAQELRGAMEITEGLLKRARMRWPLTKVAETEWVVGGINVEGGIRFREEEEGEEVL